jgi:hypothetical protein
VTGVGHGATAKAQLRKQAVGAVLVGGGLKIGGHQLPVVGSVKRAVEDGVIPNGRLCFAEILISNECPAVN